MSYSGLHQHSFFSLLDGTPSPKAIIKRAKEIGSPATSLTDHGNIAGFVDFINAGKKYGVKPIVGIELYQSKLHPSIKNKENSKHYHLTLLSKDTNGLKDLFKIVSESNRPEYFYRRPRLNLETLANFNKSKNLICLSGCIGGHLSSSLFDDVGKAISVGEQTNSIDEVKKYLKHDWRNIAYEIIEEYIKIFGKENYYLELQEENMPSQLVVVNCLREIGNALDLSTVATLDSHYCRKEDVDDHRLLLSAQLHTTIEEQEKLRQSGADTMSFFYRDTFYMLSYEEMLEHYTEKELETTLEIADKISDYKMAQKPSLPKFTNRTMQTKNLNSHSYLREICINNAKQKLGHLDQPTKKQYWERLQRELNVIETANLSDYFLIVWDFCKFVDKNNGPRGKGRGSGAGSLINYLTNITLIDPIEHGLYFERFFNVSRNIPPHFNYGDLSFMDWYSDNFHGLRDRNVPKERKTLAQYLGKLIKSGRMEFTDEMQKEVDWIDKNNQYMWSYIFDLLSLEKRSDNPNNSRLLYGFGLVDKVVLENFNPHLGHISLPDIDIDVGRDFKPKVIEYLKKRWGDDKVAQMITFGRLQGKAALKEVFRAQPELVKHLMKVRATKEGKDPQKNWMTPHDLCNEITKHIPDEASIADDLQEIRKSTDNPDYGILNWSIEHIDSIKEAYQWYKPLFDQAIRIEGTKKNQSKHAAGVVIADKPIKELVPLAYDAQSKDCVVGVEMIAGEYLGCVKFDVLGVTALDKCWSCMEMINNIGEK